MFVVEGLLLYQHVHSSPAVSQQVPYVRPALGFVPPIKPMVHSSIVLNPDVFDECAYPLLRCSHVLPFLVTAIDLD